MNEPTPPTPGKDPASGPTVRPTGVLELGLIALGVAVGTYLVVRDRVPPSIPPWAGAMLYFLAAADLWIAVLIRGRVNRGEVGPGSERLHPIAVARAVALAKASAYLGAVATGFFGVVLVFLFTEGDRLAATHDDRPGAWIGFGGALLLVAASLWLERCCRTPDDPEEQQVDTSPA